MAQPIAPLCANGTNFELLFCTHVLRLGSLHYGFSPDPRSRITTLEEIRVAQERYTQTLMDWVPEGVCHILDVGAGVGDIAAALVGRGYRVTALSPDPEHGRYFPATLQGLCFTGQRFEDYRPNRAFDLVLMSESHNYFGHRAALVRTRGLLRPGGFLLLSGIFKTREVDGVTSDICKEEDYRSLAEQAGFVLLSRHDITANVLPALAFTEATYDTWIAPSLEVLTRFFLESSWPTRTVLRLLLKDPALTLRRVRHFYDKRTRRSFFEQNLSYVRCLYQVASP